MFNYKIYIQLTIIININIYLIFFELKSANAAIKRVDCDLDREFFCWSDNKCIPKTKVCNFINDCSNGDDETRCGSCKFDKTARKCGLNLISDKFYGWHRRTPLKNDNSLISYNNILDYYIRLDLNRTLNQQILRHKNDQSLIYRPKIMFPHLRPTNNKKCSFSLKFLLTNNPARIVEESTIGISWPRVNLYLIQPKENHNLNSNDFVFSKHNKEYKLFNIDLKKNNSINKGRGEWHTYELLLGERHTVWSMELEVLIRIKSFLLYLGDFKFIDCNPIGKNNYTQLELDDNNFELYKTESPLIDNLDDELLSDNIENDDNNNNNNKKKNCTNINEFKCKLTGLCIDKSLICDFNYDCGDDDSSDEDYCDDYPGRCDFESQSMCHWLPIPSIDSWIWMTSNEDDQLFYGNLPRPPVDHTFKSNKLNGHYIMINVTQVKMSTSFGLLGPRVLLNDDSNECNFRFWAFVPQSTGGNENNDINSLNLTSPYLNVGYDRIEAKDLFSKNNQAMVELLYDIDGNSSALNDKNSNNNNVNLEALDKIFDIKSSNFGWKRFNIQLLNRNNINNRSINSLRLALENFSSNAKTFLDNNLFLAIDDISFTPGCKIIQRDQKELNENICGEHQYQCKLPTPISKAYCLPIEYYCDFKNDCGLISIESSKDSINLLSDDELNCPHRCQFNIADKEHCGIEIIDATNLKLTEQIDTNSSTNEAFDWLIVNDSDDVTSVTNKTENSGHLAIVSNFEVFLLNYNKQKENNNQFNLEEIRIELPTFSQSHANCQFELTYKWTENSKNIFASILISNDETESLLQNIKLPSNNNNNNNNNYYDDNKNKKVLTFGIGHQSKPFKLIIRVSIEDSIPHLIINKPIGSLLIYSYKFITCSFYPGLVDPKKEIEFIVNDNNNNNIDDNEYEGLVDYYDFDSSTKANNNLRQKLNTTCDDDEGFFQCFNPVVCIPRELVCDMQLDCQGGLDEANCDNYLRFNFDGNLKSFEKQLLWWNNENKLNSVWKWNRINSKTLKSNNNLELGPPYDHTKSNSENGWYLIIEKNEDLLLLEKQIDNQMAILKSPKFGVNSLKKFNECRLIIYLYFWTNNDKLIFNELDKFEILIELIDDKNNIELKLLYQLNALVINQIKKEKKLQLNFDRWQKIDLLLSDFLINSENNLSQNFSIIIRGYSSQRENSGLIAIDDISFSPGCMLLTNNKDNNNTTGTVAALGQYGNGTTSNNNRDNTSFSTNWLKYILMTLLIVIIVLIILYKRKSNLNSRSSSSWKTIFGRYYTTSKFSRIKRSSNCSIVRYSLDELGNDQIKLSTNIFNNNDNNDFNYRKLSNSDNISN